MLNLNISHVDFGEKNSDPRNSPIDRITIHHMAGNSKAVNAAQYHKNGNTVSANYYIGSDGSIVSGVSENRRSWCSSSPANDHRAITIEVANNGGAPIWPISDQAYNSLINLCVDICLRYNFSLNWTGDANGSLTTHDMFKETEYPGPHLKNNMDNIAKHVNKLVEQRKKENNY